MAATIHNSSHRQSHPPASQSTVETADSATVELTNCGILSTRRMDAHQKHHRPARHPTPLQPIEYSLKDRSNFQIYRQTALYWALQRLYSWNPSSICMEILKKPSKCIISELAFVSGFFRIFLKNQGLFSLNIDIVFGSVRIRISERKIVKVIVSIGSRIMRTHQCWTHQLCCGADAFSRIQTLNEYTSRWLKLPRNPNAFNIIQQK